MLEALVDGHPDVKVDFRLGDVVAGQELTEARGVLLQHVSVVFPPAAVSEHLRRGRESLKIQVGCQQRLQKLTHPRVQIANVSSFSILVRDFNMLVGAGMHHHVPGVPIQSISPVIVALQRSDFRKNRPKRKSNFCNSVCGMSQQGVPA